LFFRSLSGQNVHDVSVRELLNFRWNPEVIFQEFRLELR
jgi:hypothetical protein